MQQKVSIKDIANHVGTSITAVSFVINGKAKEKYISDKLAAKIRKAIDELGYQPNLLARSLRTGKSNIIGFLVDDISKPFFSGLARAIDEKAAVHGYKIIFSSTGNDRERTTEILNIYQERRVDAYVAALAEGLEAEIGGLIGGETPVVLFDRYLPGLEADYVLTDNFWSTAAATQHLIDNGFENIAFITIDTRQQQMLDRLRGYSEVIDRSGKKQEVLKIKYQDSERTTQLIKAFLQNHSHLDAVIFAANYLTMDGLKLSRTGDEGLLQSKGVVSFDDFELLEFIRPSITAVEQPIEAIAENIIQLLLKKLTGSATAKAAKPVVINLQAKLNVRQSSKPLNAQS